MKFTNSETIKFLELYEAEEVLYKQSLKDYKNKIKRTEALDRIAAAMNFPDFGGDEVFKKFRSLSSTYGQEKKKKKAVFKSGSGTEDMVSSCLDWIHIMERIKMKSKPQNLQKSSADFQLVDISDDNEDDDVMMAVEDFGPSTSKDCTPPKQKKKKINMEDKIQMLDSIVEKCKEREDDLDLFGKYVSATLRTLDKPTSLRLRGEIHNIIMQALESNLN